MVSGVLSEAVAGSGSAEALAEGGALVATPGRAWERSVATLDANEAVGKLLGPAVAEGDAVATVSGRAWRRLVATLDGFMFPPRGPDKAPLRA